MKKQICIVYEPCDEIKQGELGFLSYETAKLKIPTASSGCIYVEIDFPHADGLYYSDYEQFYKKKYYDLDSQKDNT